MSNDLKLYASNIIHEYYTAFHSGNLTLAQELCDRRYTHVETEIRKHEANGLRSKIKDLDRYEPIYKLDPEGNCKLFLEHSCMGPRVELGMFIPYEASS